MTLPTLAASLLLLVIRTPEGSAASAGFWQGRRVTLAQVPGVASRSSFWQIVPCAMLWLGAHFGLLTWLPS